MLGLATSCKLDWASYIVFIAKTASMKIGALIHFLLRLFCISINQPYGYVWNSVVMSRLVLLVTTSNCYISYKNEYVGLLALAAFLESLAHQRNVASFSFFYRYYFGRCSSELAQLAPLPCSQGRSTRYSDRSHDFSITIPRC